MMKPALLILTLLFLLNACVSEPKRSQPEAEWFNRMHRLSAAYLNVVPMVMSPKEFNNPRNQSTLDADLKNLAEIGSELEHDPKAPNSDPVIEFSAINFAADTRQAYSAFKAGDRHWTRFSIQRAGNQCIACHTRADRGAKDFSLAWKPDLSTLDTFSKIEFYLANRQYSMAMKEAERMAASESLASADSLQWLGVLERVMTMVIRVASDDKFAEKITQVAFDNRAVPFYVRSDLRVWLNDIRQWRSQKLSASPEVRFKTAQRLLETSARFPIARSHASFIANLRASAILHGLLENSNLTVYGDALMASGQASEGLGESALANYYYETCIRQRPHSLLAEKCFSHLLASLRETNPYLDTPVDYETAGQVKLAELRELAAAADMSRSRSRVDKSDDPPGH